AMNWPYLIKRARRAPRRILALLIYAQSNDIWIPNNIINELHSIIFGVVHATSNLPTSPQTVYTSADSSTNQDRLNSNVSGTMEAKDPPQARPDVYLLGHIQERLATDSRTAIADVQLSIDKKKILAQGETPTADRRRAIEDVI